MMDPRGEPVMKGESEISCWFCALPVKISSAGLSSDEVFSSSELSSWRLLANTIMELARLFMASARMAELFSLKPFPII